MKWLWIQEAVQSGRFSLKKDSIDRNVSDLTTKHHHEDRLVVFMFLGRLRFVGPKSALFRCSSWSRFSRIGTRSGSTLSCSSEDGEDARTIQQGIRVILLKHVAFGNSSFVRVGFMSSYLHFTTTIGLGSCDDCSVVLIHFAPDIPLRRKTLQSSFPRGC